MKKRNLLVYVMVGALAVCSLSGCGNSEKQPEDKIIVSTEAQSDIPDSETSTEEVTSDEDTETDVETESETEESKTDEKGVYLGDYSGFTYTREYEAPTDEDVEETIQEILDSNITRDYFEEGTVADGDTVVVSFTGSIDGDILDGLSGEEEEFTIGEETFSEEFENALIGHEVGEEFEIILEFPEDYEAEDVAGKTAVLNTVVNSIAGPIQEVELNDEWVKDNTDYATVEEYKAAIMTDLELQAEEYADSVAVYSLISDLYDVSHAEVSDDELAEGIEQKLAIYKNAAEDMGMTYEEYVAEMYAYTSGTENDGETDVVEAFEYSLKETVRSDIEKEKILAAFAEKEAVDLGDEAYEAYLEKEASLYGYESKDEFVAELESIGYDVYIRTIFKEIQVGQKLMEISELVDPEVAEPETTDGTELSETELLETELVEEDTEVVSETEFSEETSSNIVEDVTVDVEVGEEISLEELAAE